MHGNSLVCLKNSMIDGPAPNIYTPNVFQILVPKIITRTTEASSTLRQKTSEHKKAFFAPSHPTDSPTLAREIPDSHQTDGPRHDLASFIAGDIGVEKILPLHIVNIDQNVLVLCNTIFSSKRNHSASKVTRLSIRLL